MLLRFIDKKINYKDQKRYLFTYLYFGIPCGLIFVEGIKMIIDWTKYFEDFELSRFIFQIFFDVLFVSPLIINYFKHKKKYNKLIQRLDKIEEQNSKDKEHFVKAIFNFKNFRKGEIYQLKPDYSWIRPLKNGYYISDNSSYSGFDKYNLKDYINKFELQDIKEDRRKKLNKLNRLFK